ncbi:hypothetical protein SKAU_G00424430 [Synaphobranchus kaupii]|uniref:L1 transposable element RRM domain-containing protein n=1 Tax=Synaphobranchus kaupii TaxID=118154 RepID=A0A9Q1IAN3_SYNKA|nr:hypothetical protein SKAU_G00424430 [Synaphobranchus kaupii]
MEGDKTRKKLRSRRRSITEKECGKEASVSASEVCSEENGDSEDERGTATLSSIRKVVSEVMAKGLSDLKSDMKKELSEFRESFREDMKAQLDDLTTEINQKIQDVTGQIEETTRRLGEVEKSMGETEKWDIGVKDTLIQLINNQRALQDKLTDLEGRSRRNNIRIYGVPESAEGTSMHHYVEDLIKTELGDSLGLQQGKELGIERAHRALAPKPPAGATPRSVVVRFLRFTTKENVLHAAWKKNVHVQGKRVYFDHDYAEEVQRKRKEYTPIKKVLKENKIRFQTPLTRMRVHFDSGTVTYKNAPDAAVDLAKRGFPVGTIHANKIVGNTEETLTRLLPWSTAGGAPRAPNRPASRVAEEVTPIAPKCVAFVREDVVGSWCTCRFDDCGRFPGPCWVLEADCGPWP